MGTHSSTFSLSFSPSLSLSHTHTHTLFIGAIMKADAVIHYILLFCLWLHRQHWFREGGVLPLINTPQQLGW